MTETPNFSPSCPRRGCNGTISPDFFNDEWDGWECNSCYASWDRKGSVIFKGWDIP